MISNNKKRILVIDDDRADRKQIIRSLAKAELNYDVEEAETFEASMTLLESNAKYDCIFLDYMIPGVDGLESITRILKLHPYVPIIMMTGEGNEVIATQALQKGAYDYIPKHMIDGYSMARTIKNAIDRAALKKKMEIQRRDLQDFASMLAHDLRAPARHINGFMDFIETDISDGNYDKLEDSFGYIRTATKKMNALVDTLYEYTKIDGEAVFSKVSLEKVLENTTAILANDILESRARITFENLPDVYGNGTLLMQLFQNLIMNSLKYNEMSVPKIDVSAVKKDDKIEVCLKDNGIGIESKYLKKVFAPFQRLVTENQYSGSGLGLATCKKIIDRHQGDIWCESEIGKGSSFYFTLQSHS